MKYSKKPVVIEAFKWTGGRDQEDDPVWIKEAIEQGKVKFVNGFLKGNSFFGATNGPDIVMEIETLEGKMLVARGDYIIRGVRGEIYPCKPDIFEETYELAN